MPEGGAGRSVVLSEHRSPFFGPGAGLSYGVAGCRLVDVGVRSISPSDDYWVAQRRHDATRQWQLERFGGDAETMMAVYRALWPHSYRWSFGPKPGSSLNGYRGETHSGAFAPCAPMARAVQQLRAATARLSLERRPVDGWCKRGHALTPENRSGEQCRTCRNASYAAKRKNRTIEEELASRSSPAREEQRDAA